VRRSGDSFIDRAAELEFLDRAWHRPGAQLLVLYGRRRVGKTALLQQFAAGRRVLHFVATRLPEAQQLREIGVALGRMLDDPLLASDGFRTWEQVFAYLERIDGRFGLVLDEYPYLVEATPGLSSLWQRAWDLNLSRRDLVLVLCGSSVGMMERETLAPDAPLYGRRTGQLRLSPLGFRDAAGFVPRYRFEDRLRIYAVTGGVPYYLRLMDDRRPVLRNVREQVLEMGAPLRDEVEFLLREELREPRLYFGILAAIAAGRRKLSEILNATGLTAPTASKYLAVLQALGLIEREVPVTERRPEKSKKGLYRIVDPFVRFWFWFVLPHSGLLETGRITEAMNLLTERFDGFVSEAYEAVCRREVAAGLLDERTGARWARCGRWWARDAEIDLVALDAEGGAVLLGEAKWSRRPVGTNVLASLERVATRVPVPPGWRRVFALFSRSGFTPALRRLAASRSDLVLLHGLEILQ